MLRERPTGPGGDVLEASETDVALRLQGPLADDTAGVVSVTNRITGEFILELNEDAADVLQFIQAARGTAMPLTTRAGTRSRSRSTVTRSSTTRNERFVYDDEGSLLRQHSLIPSGVEL